MIAARTSSDGEPAEIRNADTPSDEGSGTTPDLVGSWSDLMRAGTSLARAGQSAEAAEVFIRALQIRPTDPVTMRQLGSAHLRAKAYTPARRVFEKALSLDPHCAASLHGLGLARHGLGMVGPALEAFRKAANAAPDTWTACESIADITADEAERIMNIDLVSDRLETSCLQSDAPPECISLCTTALINAHRAAEAVQFAKANFARFHSCADAQSALARAHYNLGNFRQAFYYKARALAAMDTGKRAHTAVFKGFDPETAASTLRGFSEILASHAIPHFLAAGTLLGFHRGGGPLSHDRDVDVGVLRNSDGSPDIAGIIREDPRLILARAARPGDRYFGLVFKGIAIDIFLHDVRDGALVCGFGDMEGDIQWRFSAFDLKRTRYQGCAFSIPDDPERYLSEIYGPGWHTPDKRFASVVSSPALYRTDTYARAYYAAGRAEKSLHAGDRAKAYALLCQSPVSFALPPPALPLAMSDPEPEDSSMR